MTIVGGRLSAKPRSEGLLTEQVGGEFCEPSGKILKAVAFFVPFLNLRCRCSEVLGPFILDVI